MCSSKSSSLHVQQLIHYCAGQRSDLVKAELSAPLSATAQSTATVAQANLPSISAFTAAETSSVAATDPWQLQEGQALMGVKGAQPPALWPSSSALLVDPGAEVT